LAALGTGAWSSADIGVEEAVAEKREAYPSRTSEEGVEHSSDFFGALRGFLEQLLRLGEPLQVLAAGRRGEQLKTQRYRHV
jgi:hypothetical protein